MKLIQCDFEMKIPNGMLHATAWVGIEWKLKVGKIVSFEETPHDRWTVTRIGTDIQEYEDIQRGWGLGLSKKYRTEY
jgi:hypothetical protein